MLVDTHCHLDFPEFNQDRNAVIQRAKEQGIGCIINIGSSLQGSRTSLELSRKYDFIYAAVGMHPHEADRFDKNTEVALKELAREDKVVAVGEIGLDYYKSNSEAENQKTLFISMIRIGREFNLPLVIHNRQANQDTLNILRESLPLRAVLHCFSGDEIFLKDCLDLGFLISFTCNITYRKAENLRSLVLLAPLEKILLETDAPFLPPQDLRGKRNEPAYVRYLAEEIARIKQITVEEVAQVTTDNAKRFFNL